MIRYEMEFPVVVKLLLTKCYTRIYFLRSSADLACGRTIPRGGVRIFLIPGHILDEEVGYIEKLRVPSRLISSKTRTWTWPFPAGHATRLAPASRCHCLYLVGLSFVRFVFNHKKK